MDSANKDVAAEINLDEILAEGDGKPGASAEQNQEQQIASEGVKTPDSTEVSGRANARIRELNDKLKEANEFIAKKLTGKERSNVLTGDVDEFLNKIEDEGTKNLLKDFGNVIKKTITAEVGSKLSPAVKELEDIKFERQFEDLASKMPSLRTIKEEVKDRYLDNPNGAVKDIVGSIILDRQMSKIKPIEGNTSQAKRERIDLNSASKEELYELLTDELSK